MHYITDQETIKYYKEKKSCNISEYIVSLIFSEQPQLAPEYKGENQDVVTLIKICRLFEKFLNDEKLSVEEFFIVPNLEFENKYHSVVSLLNEVASQFVTSVQK